jgi:hypothetical protein
MLTALREHESVRKGMLIQSDEHATLELSGKLTHYPMTCSMRKQDFLW